MNTDRGLRFFQYFFVAGLSVAAFSSCAQVHTAKDLAASPRTLKMLIWEDFIPLEIINKFSKSTQTTVQVDYFVSPQALLDQIRREPSCYDLISPPDYIVDAMIQENLLLPIGEKLEGGVQRLHPDFRNPWYDSELKYCMPLQRAVSGLAYNQEYVKNPPTCWADLFDPVRAREWSGRISLLDDPRETLAIALLAGGDDLYNPSKEALKKAKERIVAIHPFLARFDSEHFEDGLVSGALWIVHGWNGDLARAQSHNANIVYRIPEDGAVVGVDNLAISAGARNVDAALQFIAFMQRPDIAKKNTEVQGFASCLEEEKWLRDLSGELRVETILRLPEKSVQYWLRPFTPETERLVMKYWRSARDF